MFSKRKSGVLNDLADKVGIKVARCICFCQTRFGAILNKWTRHFSPTAWKVVMVCFAIAWTILSVRCITNVFNQNTIKTSRSEVDFTYRANRSDSLIIIERIYQQRKKHGNE